MPLLELIIRSSEVHKKHHKVGEVQVSTLISVKTGGCPEDCAYCPQAARYKTDIQSHKLLPLDEVLEIAGNAKAAGTSRMCLGAAWREVKDDHDFEHVLEMVKGINKMGMEVCCTLGMLTEEQAKKLAGAGLYAYNHNLDSSEEFYKDIISTRKYSDRLETIGHVRKAGITVCSGGIIGMGEQVRDRLAMLHTLASLVPQPESVPINALVPVDGTPLEDQPLVTTWEIIRMIAVTRLAIPGAMVRLSAGRERLSMESQALCFLAGANSIFAGDKLLTTPNPDFNEDVKMFNLLGLKPIPAKVETSCNHESMDSVIKENLA